MNLYKDQLSTTIPLTEFLQEYTDELAYNAIEALLEYDGLSNETNYDNYLVFHVTTQKNGEDIFAITRIIDEWQPIEVSSRIRMFTRKKVYPSDSYARIYFI